MVVTKIYEDKDSFVAKSRLVVTSVGSHNGHWLVRFHKLSSDRRRTVIDQIAAYNPGSGGWDQKRWSPVGSAHVSGAALRQVEEWLARQGVPG